MCSGESTPVSVRFSNSTGIPVIPDNDPKADPRGMAIRFHLAEHVHTDIVSHSADGFPTHTPEEFLELLRAIGRGHPETFLATHPATLAFVQMPKPAPASFATERYFGVTAMKFANAQGVERFGRYRITPEAGVEHLGRGGGPDQKRERTCWMSWPREWRRGPVRFQVAVQVAEDGDTVNDATVHWPETRPQVQLGTIELDTIPVEKRTDQQQIIFDPIPRVDGIEPSDDPLLELRAAIYLISGRRRRGAKMAVKSIRQEGAS